MSDNEQPAHRRALAKALTSYGYKYDACIEELFISNDDLTVAAAALVKRFGNPSEKMRPTTNESTVIEEQTTMNTISGPLAISSPRLVPDESVIGAESSTSNETLEDGTSAVAQKLIQVNSGTPLRLPLSERKGVDTVMSLPTPLPSKPSIVSSRKATITASVEGKTSEINLSSLTDAAEAVISSVDAVLGKGESSLGGVGGSSKKRAKVEKIASAETDANDIVLAEGGEDVVIYASTLDGAFLQLKRLSVMLSASILESSAPSTANVAMNLGEDGDNHQPVVPLVASCLAANIPTTTIISLVSSLQRYVSNAQRNKGLLLNLLSSSADASSSVSASTSVSAISNSDLPLVSCGLEAAYCAVLLMSAPGIDRRVISEQLLSDVIKLTRFQVSTNIVPCYDAFDSFWRSAGLSSSGQGIGKGKQGKQSKMQSTKKGSSKVNEGEDLDLESDFDISSDAEEEDDASKIEAKDSGIEANDSASKSLGVLQATPKLMASALSLMRPILLQLCRLVEQLGTLVENVPNLSSGMVSSLEELSLLASTQTSGRSEDSIAPTKSRKTSGNVALSIAARSGHGVEGALQLAAMALLQAVFERYIPSRRQVFADLVAAQVKVTGGKKARRDFIAISQLTKPHLAGAETVGASASNIASSTVSMAKKAALEAKSLFDPKLPGGSEFQGKTTRVSACTALALHLIHSAAALPTNEEIQKISSLPVKVKSEATTSAGQQSLSKQALPSTAKEAAGAPAPENDNMNVSVKQTPKVADKSTKVVVAVSATSSKEGQGRGRKRGAFIESTEAEEVTSVITNASVVVATTPAASPPIPHLNPSALAISTTMTSSGVKSTQQPSAGFQSCRSLCQLYVHGIVSWCDRRLKGESTMLSTAADTEDPKFVLRRFADDLLNLLDMPEWPAAELMLNYLTFELVNRMSEAGSGGGTPFASTPQAITSVSNTLGPASKGAKNMASLAVLILGTIVSRIQLCRSYAKKHVIALPPPLPERPAGSVPHDEGETVACICGKSDTQEGVFHISCDSCYLWFHGACVGIIEGEFEESDKWFCDDCRMRSQVKIQSERAAAFVDKMKTAKGGDSIKQEESLDIDEKKQSIGGGGGSGKKRKGAQSSLSEESATGSAVLHPVTSPDLPAVDDFDTVCKQLLLNYVTELGHLDLFARSGRHFLIARWASESLQARKKDLVLYFSSFWAMPEKALLRERRSNIVLSSFNTSRLHLQLLSSLPLLSATDKLLGRLLSSADAGQSKARATLMKALSELVTAEPSLMKEPVIIRAVEKLLNDDSKMVRSEAVDLVGKHLLSSPHVLLKDYYTLLLSKLHDQGILTRKKVVFLFRELILRRMLDYGQSKSAILQFSGVSFNPVSTSSGTQTLAPPPPPSSRTADAIAAAEKEALLLVPLLLPPDTAQQSQVLRELLSRASDRHEEESVKDAVTEAFQAFWFAPPSREAIEAINQGMPGQRVLIELASRTAQVLSVVDASGTDDKGTDWLVKMLRRIMAHEDGSGIVDNEQSASGKREAQRVKKAAQAFSSSAAGANIPGMEKWSPIEVCGTMVDVLMRVLVALGQRRTDLILLESNGPTPTPTSSTEQGGSVTSPSASHPPAEESSTPASPDAEIAQAPNSPSTGSLVSFKRLRQQYGGISVASAQRTFERELVAVVTSLHAFAQASPKSLGKHINTLAPYLKGEPLLSARGSTVILQRISGILEAAIPVAIGLQRSTIVSVERDLLALMCRGKPTVMQSAGSALGILTSSMNCDTTNVRGLVQRMYSHLKGLQAKCQAEVVAQLGKQGKKIESVPPQVAEVLWMRQLSSHGSTEAVNSHYREALVSLYGLGLLIKFCDLDSDLSKGSARSTSDDNAESDTSMSARKGKSNNKNKVKDGKESTFKLKKQQQVQEIAGNVDEDGEEEEGWLSGRRLSTQSTATYGRGKGLPVPRVPGTGGSLLGLGSSSKAQKPDDTSVQQFQLEMGVISESVYNVLLDYARASLEIAEASYKKAIRMQFDLNSLLASERGDEDEHGLDAMADVKASETRDAAYANKEKALVFLAAPEAIAVRALRGLGFACARNPRLMLSEKFRKALTSSFSHPLWQVREAVLLLLRDLLLALEERSAVGRAIASRSNLDTRKAAALGQKSTSNAADDLVAVTMADGRVVMGKRGVLGDVDGDSSIMTGVVQENMDAVRELLFFEPSEMDVDAGVAPLDADCGERVRAAAVSLMAVVVRQGVTSPDAVIHSLVAMSTDERQDISAQAHAQLLELSEKYPARVELHAVGGIAESYTFQMRVYGKATPRSISSVTNFPESLLARFYSQCISRTPSMDSNAPILRSRLSFLRKIVIKAVPDEIPGLASGSSFSSSSVSIATDESSSIATAPTPGAGVGLLARLSGGLGGKMSKDVKGINLVSRVNSSLQKSPLSSAVSEALSVDPGLQRYLAQTLMFLPFEREEDPLTIIAYINRQVSLHGDVLIGSFSEYTVGIESDLSTSKTGGDARPIPSVGTLAYAQLAVHSAYAWALITLLHAKIFLKSLYGLKDDKVAAFNPHVAVATHDRPTNPFASVLTSDLALLPAIPSEISQALFDAQTFPTPVSVTPSLASAANLSTSGSSPGMISQPSSLFGTRGITALFLHSLSVQLESLILDTVTDVSATLPLASKKRATNAARREKTAGKGVALVSAAAQLARKTASAAAKKASKSSKRKRHEDDDDDEEDEVESVAPKGTDNDEGGKVSKRTSLRARRKTDRLGAGIEDDEDESSGT